MEELRVTLAWTDPPPSVVSDGSIVNDLDLTLYYTPSSTMVKEQLWPLLGLEAGAYTRPLFSST